VILSNGGGQCSPSPVFPPKQEEGEQYLESTEDSKYDKDGFHFYLLSTRSRHWVARLVYHMLLNLKECKICFPIFQKHPNLVYLDSASSTQTPQTVLDAVNDYYINYRANIHRGLYDLSGTATQKYEEARKTVGKFISASSKEIVFTSGTTHGLNLLASGVQNTLQPGDNIVLTEMEHHANLIPWQKIAKKKGMELRFIPMNREQRTGNSYELGVSDIENLIDEKTKIVSFTLVSNTLGTINPAEEIIARAKKIGAITIVDAAQAMAHMPIDVKILDCDFMVFSGHKMYGPTGIGVLYGKKERLEALEPFFYGGDMVRSVSYEDATWADVPEKFEGGTPNIAGAIGLGAAVEFIQSTGFDKIQNHETQLTNKLINQLNSIPDARIIGLNSEEKRIGVVSFLLKDIHPHDVAEILNRDQVCVRTGHHCTMPLMKKLGLPGTVRASVGIYNTEDDIDKLFASLARVMAVFK